MIRQCRLHWAALTKGSESHYFAVGNLVLACLFSAPKVHSLQHISSSIKFHFFVFLFFFFFCQLNVPVFKSYFPNLNYSPESAHCKVWVRCRRFGFKEAATQSFMRGMRSPASICLPCRLSSTSSSRFRVILIWTCGSQDDCKCTVPKAWLDHSKCSSEEWGRQVHPSTCQGHTQVLQGPWRLQWGKIKSIWHS